MRLSVALGCLLLVGCSGPHSTGALWAQQNLEREIALYRLSDAQRTDRAHGFELGLADATLAAERARIDAGLQACPGAAGDRQPLGLSIGDRPRDTVRIRVQDDPARLAALAQVALADWQLRRGRAAGDARFCDAARQALAGAVPVGSVTDVLAEAGSATVTRDPAQVSKAAVAWPTNVALSSYALGYVDAVQAQVPLPQYLAAVYGGVVIGASTPPALNGETPEEVVDRLAPAYPLWEPDALLAALTAR